MKTIIILLILLSQFLFAQDSTKIVFQEEVVVTSDLLKKNVFPLDEKAEAYHEEIRKLGQDNIITVKIDSLFLVEDILHIYSSIINNTVLQLFVIETEEYFGNMVVYVIAPDGKKEPIRSLACPVGEKVHPDSSDLITIYPNQKIVYPVFYKRVNKSEFYNENNKISLEYIYSLPKLRVMPGGQMSEESISIYNKAFRGKVESVNSIEVSDIKCK